MENQLSFRFSRRMQNIPRSFIREILKVVNDPQIISFAGGLPNPDLFPIREIEACCARVLREDGAEALQYSTTEGYLPLRRYLAERYRRHQGLVVHPDEILITNGSQQGVDLLGKVFVDEGDRVLIESPSYLGAIQALRVYQPEYVPVPLREDGLDTVALAKALASGPAKLLYGIPNFQNPSGISYSAENRQQVAEVLKAHATVFVEDDPYRELRFQGQDLASMRAYLGDQAILLGSFSKIFTPSFRLGWICAAREVMERLVIAKQAGDLHTNYFAQRVVYQYLTTYDMDAHISRVRQSYGQQAAAMREAMARYLPAEVTATKPDGGMFIWATLPEGMSAMALFQVAVKKGVAFVPGTPFYVNGEGDRQMRLSYSNMDQAHIETGVQRLAEAIEEIWQPGGVLPAPLAPAAVP